MEKLIRAVKTYRLTSGLAERLRLAEEVFEVVEPNLRLFVFGRITTPVAADVLQEILKAVATNLGQFKGNTDAEFWGWCYGVARNKLRDQFRRQANDRHTPMPPADLWQLVEASTATRPPTPADAHDLKLAMALLNKAQPGCYEFLWKHFVVGLAYAEIAEESNSTPDAVRMRIGRCISIARSLLS